MDDDFNDRGMQLIAVAHRRRAAFNIADVAAFIGHQNGAFKLPGLFGVDAEIGRQLHRAADALRHIDKGAVRSHRGVQRGKEVVIPRHYGAQILFTSSGWSWIASPKEQKMIPCSASFSR